MRLESGVVIPDSEKHTMDKSPRIRLREIDGVWGLGSRGEECNRKETEREP